VIRPPRLGWEERIPSLGGAVAGQDQGFASDCSIGDQIVEIVGLVVVCSRIVKSSMINTNGRVYSRMR
jgi:hypothetical protein